MDTRPAQLVRRHFSESARHGLATHTHAAIGWCHGGQATFELAGRHTLAAGDLFVVPAGTPHRWLEADRLDVSGVALPSYVSLPSVPIVGIPTNRHTHVAHLFRELGQELARPSPSPRVTDSLIALVLVEVERAAPAPVVYGEAVTRALAFIEAHACEPISLSDVAAAVGASPAHLTTIVRRATGRTVLVWIIEQRMREARRLLDASDELVEVIAERVGYLDARHFTRLFVRATGMTPSAWRQRVSARSSARG